MDMNLYKEVCTETNIYTESVAEYVLDGACQEIIDERADGYEYCGTVYVDAPDVPDSFWEDLSEDEDVYCIVGLKPTKEGIITLTIMLNNSDIMEKVKERCSRYM